MWKDLCFHHTPGAMVTKNCSALLELHHAGKDLSTRGRFAVDQNNQITFKRAMTFALDCYRRGFVARQSLACLHVVIENTRQIVKHRVKTATGCATQVDNERFVIARFAE